MKQILNYTPHSLNVVDVNGVTQQLPSVGVVRLATSKTYKDQINGFGVVSTDFLDVTGLPSPQDGVYYVVSRLVMSACPDRSDLLCPGELIRDSAGNVTGCDGFSL